MRPAIDDLLDRCGHAATRAQLLRVVGRSQLDDEIRRRRLVAVFPRVYARPWDVDQAQIRDRAALLCAGRGSMLSHLTALRRWQLPVPPCDQVHVTTTAGRHPRGCDGLIVHRPRALPPWVRLGGLPTAGAAHVVVTSWPLVRGSDQRAPAVVGVRTRVLTTEHLRRALNAAPRLAERAELVRLVDLLSAGCESELELWGYTRVFDAPGLRHAVRQRVIRVRGASYRLDMGYEDEQLAVELDGRRYHADRRQWERDIKRDLALATIGWQTVRLSHERLTRDVEGCRRDVLAVLAARRRRPPSR